MNHKDNNKITVLSMISLCIAVVGISISFLVLSSDIKIKEEEVHHGKDWLVEFNCLTEAVTSGSASEILKPTISKESTVISGFNVKFNQPKDFVSYSLSLANKGRIDSVLEVLNKSKPNCKTEKGNKNKDTEMVCKNIDYYLTLDDGTKVETGLKLKSNEKLKLNLTIKYNGSTLPNETVIVDGLSLVAIFVQDEK